MSEDTPPHKSSAGVLKRFGLPLLKLLVSGGLLYFVLSRTGIENVGAALMSVNPWAFALSVIIFLVMLLCGAIRWGFLLPEHFKLARLFSLYMIGSFFNIFMPGLVGGDVVKIYYLYRHTKQGPEATASVFMDRFMGYAALMSLGMIMYPFGFQYFGDSWIVWVLPAIVAAFVIVSFLLFRLRLGSRFESLNRIYAYFSLYAARQGVIRNTWLMGMVIHTLNSFMVYAITVGLGLDVPLIAVMVFVPVIATLAAVPLSISGLGIREAAFVLLFGKIGIGTDMAVAVSFLWFIAIACGGLPGALFYLREKHE